MDIEALIKLTKEKARLIVEKEIEDGLHPQIESLKQRVSIDQSVSSRIGVEAELYSKTQELIDEAQQQAMKALNSRITIVQ